MLDNRIRNENPWYRLKDEINRDNKIIDWNKSSLKWDPRLRQKFDYSNDIVYTIRGPRQVGKTTLLKLQIKDLLDKDISPWNIFYYAFDIDVRPKEIINIIENYIENTKHLRKDGRRYLFLDEMSSSKNWQKAIKILWDNNRLSNCTTLITGSHALDLKKSTEKLPGRRGLTNDIYDKILLPMKFSEYVCTMDSDLNHEILSFRNFNCRFNIFKQLLDFKIDDKLYNLATNYLTKLNNYLLDYLITGGFAMVINEYRRNAYINEYVYTTYINSVVGDTRSLDMNETSFKQLSKNIINNINWPQSWESLRKNTGIASLTTVGRYIDLLCNMFVLTLFLQFDMRKKTGIFKNSKRIHFHDVFFFHILNTYNSSKSSFELSQEYVSEEKKQGSLIEGIVGNHLIRLAFNMSHKKQIFDYSNHIFFWRYGSKQENEVDYIFYDGDKIEVPIEVKYKGKITSRDIDGIINYKRKSGVKNALLITKDTLEINREYVALPASVFLLLA